MIAPRASLAEAADAAGLSYERFRRVWPAWVRAGGFPAPFRDARPYAWDPAALTAWRERAAGAVRDRLSDPAPPAPANDAGEAPPPPRARLRREQGELAKMMRGAAHG